MVRLELRAIISCLLFTLIFYMYLPSTNLCNYHNVCLLFYVLGTYKVISGWVPTRDSAHSWQLYNAATLGNQVVNTMA